MLGENVFMRFLVSKGLINGDVGVARRTVFQEIRRGAGFKIRDFVKKVGGATVERLKSETCVDVSV